MNTDIRLMTSFKSSRKRIRFEMLMGKNSSIYIIYLWLTVAVERPDGVLTGWDETDIAIASQYEGNAQAYADALLESCILDLDHTGYRVHDWNEYQVWATKAKERSEIAKKAAAARWEKRLNSNVSKNKCSSNAQAMHKKTKSNAPSPYPNPKDIIPAFDEFWSVYPRKVEKEKARAAWKKLNPSDEQVNDILHGVLRYKATDDWNKENGKFIPYPERFLKNRRWEDEVISISSMRCSHAPIN